MKKLKSNLAVKITAVFLLTIFCITFCACIFGIAYMYYDYNPYTLFTESQICNEAIYNYTWQIYNNYVNDTNNLRNNLKANNLNLYFHVTNANGEIVFSNYSHDLGESQPHNIVNVNDVKIYIFLKNTIEGKNFIYYAKILFDMRYALFGIATVLLIAIILTGIFLIAAAGHRKDTDKIIPSYIDRVPIDLLAGIFIGLIVCVYNIVWWRADELYIVLILLSYFLLVTFIMSFAVRCKLHTLFTNTVIFYIFHYTYVGIKLIPSIWRTAVAVTAFVLINLLFIMGELYFFNIVLVLIALAYVCYHAILLNKIKVGTEKISSGDINYKIDTSMMIFDLRTIGEKVNNISDGLSNAVNERLRSEHFKSELITNVSHDIKTPLTSIINYVDLLKKEEIGNETAGEYIEILDRQSNKLKKLTEDLLDASKASTGNVIINLAELDIIELLGQSIGEYSEKFADVGIEPILNLHGIETYTINSDGRLLWRIFDNLFNNIYKYAMNNTRVYIDFAIVNDSVMIGVKNISRDPLNVTADELMERFIRGDSSRTTEGSGLGLSISRSLTEILGGKLNLYIDGDLFKVLVILNHSREN